VNVVLFLAAELKESNWEITSKIDVAGSWVGKLPKDVNLFDLSKLDT